MQNPKIIKIKAEIDKTKAKISEIQAKLRVLERQKTEIENEQIVALVRNEKISDAELNALMKAIRKGEPESTIEEAAHEGEPESTFEEAAIPDKPKRQEELHNAKFEEI